MELDAVTARIFDAFGRINEAFLDMMNLFHRQFTCMTLFFKRTSHDIDEVIIVDGTRAGMIELRDKAHIIGMDKFCGPAELRGENIRVNIDLLRIGTAERVDTAVPRDDCTHAVLGERFIHVILGIGHAAVCISKKTMHGRTNDAVLKGKVLQLQRLFDDAHDFKFSPILYTFLLFPSIILYESKIKIK